jgi:hypothetical protein
MNRRAGNAGIGMSTIREDHFQHRSGSARSSPYWRRFFEVNCMGAFPMTLAAHDRQPSISEFQMIFRRLREFPKGRRDYILGRLSRSVRYM